MSQRISRHTRPLELVGLGASHWAHLTEWLAEKRWPSALLATDLTFGTWQAQHIANELAHQVQRPLPPPPASGPTPSSLAYGDLVGRGIDAEAAGDKALINAVDSLAHLAPALATLSPHTIVVLLPRATYTLGADNAAFVYLLAQWLETQSAHKLLLVDTDGSHPQPGDGFWQIVYEAISAQPLPKPAPLNHLLAYTPSLLADGPYQAAPRTSARTDAWVTLPGGQHLLKPEYRPTATPPADMPPNPLFGRPLLAFWQYHNQPDSALMGQAWQLFGGGCTDIAIKLAVRCVAAAQLPIMRGVLLAQLQGMRIATMRFAEAAAEAEPAAALPTGIRSFLHQAIGWGLAMTNRLPDAKRQFEWASTYQEPTIAPLEKAYFDNIQAFLHYRMGDADQAFRLEKGIEALHQTVPEEDFRLTYINSINQARLYKSVGDLVNAETYYERAFATTLGNRSESDLVYVHVCRALLRHDQNEPEACFREWVLAALHWAAATYPEAVGGRTLTAILNTHRLPPLVERVEATAQAFVERIVALGALLNRDLTTELTGTPCVFVHASQRPGCEAVLGNDWLLVGTDNVPSQPAVVGPQSDRLRALLTNLLTAELGTLAHQPTIVVDDRGLDEAPSRAGLWLLGWQWAANRLRWQGTELAYPENVLPQVRVALSPAVARRVAVPGGSQQLQFKRYLQPLTLTDKAADWVDGFAVSPTLGQLWQRHDKPTIDELLRVFQQRRIVSLSLPDEALNATPALSSNYASSLLV
ncbi:tetratricopeptide repeat protein [Fibrella sp. WM1]|uniref:tetratricopeptide repeat protein n=1 Tax=Fibrella musci TaxID=3242485 RepID=UPI0035213344